MNKTSHLLQRGDVIHFITYARENIPELYITAPEAGLAVHITDQEHVLMLAEHGDANIIADIIQTYLFTHVGETPEEAAKPAQMAKVLGVEAAPLDMSIVSNGWLQVCYTVANVKAAVYMWKCEEAVIIAPECIPDGDDAPPTVH